MIIPGYFNGPPGSGNGGYCAGVFAQGARAEVTLRLPPPLDTPLEVADGQVRTADGAVVAEVAPVDGFASGLTPVSHADAVTASREYAGFVDHPFPTCYVCGPQRPDGLRIFPGRVAEHTTAAPWTVPAQVETATVWAALDCPGGWAVLAPGRPYVLGRIAVQVDRLPVPDEQCVVVGAMTATEGRKAQVRTALFGADGTELARARATWVALAR